MQLANDINNNIKTATKLRLPWWGIVCIIITALPTYWMFDYFGKLSIALPTLNCIGMLIFAVAVKRNLRRYLWFWITIAILGALHVPLILFVPWTTKWVPSIAIAAIDSADLTVVLVVLSMVERFVKEPKASEI